MFSKPAFEYPQDRRAKFLGETPDQQAKHREIDRRYRKRTGKPDRLFVSLRKATLEKLFTRRYRGRHLPNDDAGRGDLRLMADHLAQLGPDHIRWWAAEWMPDLSENDLDELIHDVGPGKRWKPIPLGEELNLTHAEWLADDIRTIRPVDRTKAQLDKDRRKRNAERERARRRAAGAMPRTQSATQTKPWKLLGISKATYYRRQKRAKTGCVETAETNSCAVLLISPSRT